MKKAFPWVDYQLFFKNIVDFAKHIGIYRKVRKHRGKIRNTGQPAVFSDVLTFPLISKD